MFLLNEAEGGDGLDDVPSHPSLFTEMGELTGVGVDQEWKETARYLLVIIITFDTLIIHCERCYGESQVLAKT